MYIKLQHKVREDEEDIDFEPVMNNFLKRYLVNVILTLIFVCILYFVENDISCVDDDGVDIDV